VVTSLLRFTLPRSVGSNEVIRQRLGPAVARLFNLPDAHLAAFTQAGAHPHRATLYVAGTDRIYGGPYWFEPGDRLTDALVACSAIPGIFPWQSLPVKRPDKRGRTAVVDGGVCSNQPVSKLALDGRCGTILACAVGYFGEQLAWPTNALDNAVPCLNLMSHQASKLEEDYVRLKMGAGGVVHHIHPQVTEPPKSFDFTSQKVQRVVDEACRLTVGWLDENKQKVLSRPHFRPHIATEPLNWLAEQWDDDVLPS
jgi:predicted acylesterase/phospholipase RssA